MWSGGNAFSRNREPIDDSNVQTDCLRQKLSRIFLFRKVRELGVRQSIRSCRESCRSYDMGCQLRCVRERDFPFGRFSRRFWLGSIGNHRFGSGIFIPRTGKDRFRFFRDRMDHQQGIKPYDVLIEMNASSGYAQTVYFDPSTVNSVQTCEELFGPGVVMGSFGFSSPGDMIIDHAGNVWVSNGTSGGGGNSVTEIIGVATP